MSWCSTRDIKILGAISIVLIPNICLSLIQPNPNGLQGNFYEIFIVEPDFTLYYLAVLLTSLFLIAVTLQRKSSMAGLTAYALFGSSLFVPTLLNLDWLTFRDVLLHGSWIVASSTHFAQIFPYSQWPGAWITWLTVCRLLSVDPFQGSVVVTAADWIMRLTATAALGKILLRQMGLGDHLSYVLAIVMLALYQNQGLGLIPYYDSSIAQSLSIIVFCLIIRIRPNTGHAICLATLSLALVVTHPFYTALLGFATIGVLLLGSHFLRQRYLHTDILLVFVLICLLWVTYYGGAALASQISTALSSAPQSGLFRAQTLGVSEPLPLYGVMFRQLYKYAVLPLVGVLALICLVRRKLPTTSKLVIVLYTLGASALWIIFLAVPGFEDRVVIFALFGLSMLAALQIGALADQPSRVKRVIAFTFLILLIVTPFFLNPVLVDTIYSGSVTESMETTLQFSTHFPNGCYAVTPMSVYLTYVDPYGTHFNDIFWNPFGVAFVSPHPGLTLILTLPPGRLAANPYISGVVYADTWNSSSRVYVSGGVIGYYTATQ